MTVKLYKHQENALQSVKGLNHVDVKGYEGLYSVSSTGEIYSVRSGIRLKACKDKRTGYMRVNLYKQGKVKHCYIHRLVAEAFLDNPSNFTYVNHIDCDKCNNDVNNLEWCTQKHNIHESMVHDLQRHMRVNITNVATGETNQFYSMREASRYLGKYENFICIEKQKRGNSFLLFGTLEVEVI